MDAAIGTDSKPVDEEASSPTQLGDNVSTEACVSEPDMDTAHTLPFLGLASIEAEEEEELAGEEEHGQEAHCSNKASRILRAFKDPSTATIGHPSSKAEAQEALVGQTSQQSEYWQDGTPSVLTRLGSQVEGAITGFFSMVSPKTECDSEAPLRDNSMASLRFQSCDSLEAPPPQRDESTDASLERYLIDNSVLQTPKLAGLRYRYTKSNADKRTTMSAANIPAGPLWGEIVDGIDEGDGWLKVSVEGRQYYLPMALEGTPVISPVKDHLPPPCRQSSDIGPQDQRSRSNTEIEA